MTLGEINIEVFDTGIEIVRPIQLTSETLKIAWRRLTRAVLERALLERPVALAFSNADAEPLYTAPHHAQQAPSGDRGTLVVVSSATPKLLEEVTERWEWEIGYLWLFANPEVTQIQAMLEQLAGHREDLARPSTTLEILRLDWDGRLLQWLNPSAPVEQLASWLTELIDSVS